MKICVTGHRPNKLYGYNLSKCVVKPLALAIGISDTSIEAKVKR